MRKLFLSHGLRFAAFGVASVTAFASRADDSSFSSEVRPIFAKHCLECHGADEPEKGLDLTSVPKLLNGSKAGAVLSPGHARASLLMQVLSKDAEPHMPPDSQLTEAEMATLAKWIDGLPPAPEAGTPPWTPEDVNHWAFQPMVRPPLPDVEREAWVRTPVDTFILARLEDAGLSPNTAADKATWLRRVYFDLIGLPPAPEEVTAFQQDDSPLAYDAVVDRLLASPRYGERWGRHWLDLARYADSGGFHQDFDRPNAWRYRDYVVNSLNRDKPYATFVQEQVAGDLLPEATVESWIATGFGRNGPSNEDNMGKGLAQEMYRLDQLDDVIATTSNVFLGLTLGCARCHDHKFDPLSQRDYYRFLAFFDSTSPRRLAIADFDAAEPKLLPATHKPDKTLAAMVRTDVGLPHRETRLLWRGSAANPGPLVDAAVPRILASSEMESPTRLDLAAWLTSADHPLTWRVMANRLWQYHFGQGLVATPSNFGRLGQPPSHPELLDWLAVELQQSGGLKRVHKILVTSATYGQSSQAGGAGQQVDPENRLLWRMHKRRLEAEPLRDAFLAVGGNLNLRMGGPGVKPRIRPDLLVASQRNKWPVIKKDGPVQWRRSVYVYVKRQLQLPMMEMFGAPPSTHSCAQRQRSLVPTQSLVLLNDDFMRDQAARFAGRLPGEAGDHLDAQVERAFWIALGRAPTSQRVDQAVRFVTEQSKRLAAGGLSPVEADQQALIDFCHVLMNLSEFSYID